MEMGPSDHSRSAGESGRSRQFSSFAELYSDTQHSAVDLPVAQQDGLTPAERTRLLVINRLATGEKDNGSSSSSALIGRIYCEVQNLERIEPLRQLLLSLIRADEGTYEARYAAVVLDSAFKKLGDLRQNDQAAQDVLVECAREVHRVVSGADLRNVRKSDRRFVPIHNILHRDILREASSLLVEYVGSLERPESFYPAAYSFISGAFEQLNSAPRVSETYYYERLDRCTSAEVAFVAESMLFLSPEDLKCLEVIPAPEALHGLLGRLGTQEFEQIGSVAIKCLRLLDSGNAAPLESLRGVVDRGGEFRYENDRERFTLMRISGCYAGILTSCAAMLYPHEPQEWKEFLEQIGWHPALAGYKNAYIESHARRLAGDMNSPSVERLRDRAEQIKGDLLKPREAFAGASLLEHVQNEARRQSSHSGPMPAPPVDFPPISPFGRSDTVKRELPSRRPPEPVEERDIELRALFLLTRQLNSRGVKTADLCTFLLAHGADGVLRKEFSQQVKAVRSLFSGAASGCYPPPASFEVDLCLSAFINSSAYTDSYIWKGIVTLLPSASTAQVLRVYELAKDALTEIIQKDHKFHGTLLEKVAYDNLPAEPDPEKQRLDWSHIAHIERAVEREERARRLIALLCMATAVLPHEDYGSKCLSEYLALVDSQRVNAANVPAILAGGLETILAVRPEAEREAVRVQLQQAIESKDTAVRRIFL
jgi:hypothetical protein